MVSLFNVSYLAIQMFISHPNKMPKNPAHFMEAKCCSVASCHPSRSCCVIKQPPGWNSAFWWQFAPLYSDITPLFYSHLGCTHNGIADLFPNSCAKALTSLLQKAVSLSIRNLYSGPHSKNTNSSYWIMLAKSCLTNCF